MIAILHTAKDVCIFLMIISSLINLYLLMQERGPLTGTPMQRLKCFFGFHDWRLFAFTSDPWRLIWRCHRCASEHLTPDTHAKRVESDRQLPAGAATGKTVPLEMRP